MHLCCHGRLRSQFWRVQGRFWKGLGGVLEGLGEGFRRALAYIRCMKKCTARLPRLHSTARPHCTPRIFSRNGFINAMTPLSHLPQLFFSPMQRGNWLFLDRLVAILNSYVAFWLDFASILARLYIDFDSKLVGSLPLSIQEGRADCAERLNKAVLAAQVPTGSPPSAQRIIRG